jgi:hypothetical protein
MSVSHYLSGIVSDIMRITGGALDDPSEIHNLIGIGSVPRYPVYRVFSDMLEGLVDERS